MLLIQNGVHLLLYDVLYQQLIIFCLSIYVFHPIVSYTMGHYGNYLYWPGVIEGSVPVMAQYVANCYMSES